MDSAAAPIVVSGDSSSESEEPSNVPVLPSSSTAANSSSPDPTLLERLLAPQQSELSRMRAVRQNSGASSSRKKALLARPHSKHSSCWNPGASLP